MPKRKLDPDYEHVNHPPHYQGKIECIDYIEDKLSRDEYIGFLKGTVLKYMSRLGKKENDLDDSKKAAWYLEKLIEVYRNNQFQTGEIKTAMVPSIWNAPDAGWSTTKGTLTTSTNHNGQTMVIDGNPHSPTYGKILTEDEQEQRRKFWEESY